MAAQLLPKIWELVKTIFNLDNLHVDRYIQYQYSQDLTVSFKLICKPFPDTKCIYTRQKKKHTTTIFPLRSPFNSNMLIVMTYSFLIKIY